MRNQKFTEYIVFLILLLLLQGCAISGNREPKTTLEIENDSIPFSYDILYCRKGKTQNKSKDLSNTYGFSFPEIKENNRDNYVVKYVLDSALNIVHYKYKYRDTTQKDNDFESISIDKDTFQLNSLFTSPNAIGFGIESIQPLHFSFISERKINIRGKAFVLLRCSFDSPLMNIYFTFWLLLENIANHWNAYSFVDASEGNELCFGDFNCDKKIDYLYRGFELDTLNLFSLQNNYFIKSQEYYLVSRSSKQQIILNNNRGYISGNEIIIPSKSRWFKNLQNLN